MLLSTLAKRGAALEKSSIELFFASDFFLIDIYLHTGWKEKIVAKTCLNSIRSGMRTQRARALKFDIQRDLYSFIYSSKNESYNLITSYIRALKVLQVFLMYSSSSAPQTRMTYLFRDTIVM